MAGLGTGAGAPVVKVYHEKSMILPDVSRVLACLYEKNIEFETVKDSYKDILRLQSTRSVPVPFYDGPTFRQESRAICRYIAETYEQRGYPFLLGKDVLERASIEQWLRHEEHAFDPPSRALFCHLAFPMYDEDMSDIDREMRKLEEVLEVYEQRLGESEYLAGNKFTLADLVHLPNTHHIVTSEKFAYLYDSRKNVQRWWNTISARDSWQQVVRDMQSVEEQNQIDELEQQQLEEQWQWETEAPPTSGRRSLRIDPRQQTGTESRTVLVPPPSDGAISSSFSTVHQEQQPLHTETTSHGETSPNQRKGSNFFSTTNKTQAPSKQRTSTTEKPPSSVESTTSNFFTPATPPTTTKMSHTTDTDKSTQKSPSSVQNTASSFFTPPATTKMPHKTNTDKSTSKDASSPTRSSPGSSKEAPDKLHLSDFYKASSHADEPDDSQTTRSPYTRPPTQRATDTSGPEAGQRSSNQRSVVQTGYAQQTSEQANKAKAEQRGAAQFPEQVATKDIQSETAPQGRYRDDKDSIKEAREADQKRDESATTELPSGSQNTPQQSKALPTNLKASNLSPTQEEYEDTQGEDGRFSTKRLRKMLEQSDPAALKSQSTGTRDPSTPSTDTRNPDSPTADDASRATSPPKEGIAPDGHGASATELRKLPSRNEKQPAPPMPSQSTSSVRRSYASSNGASEDDDLAQSNIDQWRHTSTPAIKQGVPSDPSIDKLDKTAGVDRKEQPNKALTGQSDKSARQPPPADTRRTSASTPPAPLQEPSSDGRTVSRALQGDITDARRDNEAVTNPRDQQPKTQSDRSGISPQDNGKQGSDAAFLKNADQHSGKTPGQDLKESQKQTFPVTQQVKNNRSNSTPDGSNKPT